MPPITTTALVTASSFCRELGIDGNLTGPASIPLPTIAASTPTTPSRTRRPATSGALITRDSTPLCTQCVGLVEWSARRHGCPGGGVQRSATAGNGSTIQAGAAAAFNCCAPENAARLYPGHICGSNPKQADNSFLYLRRNTLTSAIQSASACVEFLSRLGALGEWRLGYACTCRRFGPVITGSIWWPSPGRAAAAVVIACRTGPSWWHR